MNFRTAAILDLPSLFYCLLKTTEDNQNSLKRNITSKKGVYMGLDHVSRENREKD